MSKPKTKLELHSPFNAKATETLVEETGKTARVLIASAAKLGDRFIQASLQSPYSAWAMTSLFTALGVRMKLWSKDTSNLVTATGLTLLGAETIIENLPLVSSLAHGEAMIDNKWDESKVVSPWAIETGSRVDDLLITAKELQ